jgi:pimeloyl-ACP methyl ester carboxylesterase
MYRSDHRVVFFVVACFVTQLDIVDVAAQESPLEDVQFVAKFDQSKQRYLIFKPEIGLGAGPVSLLVALHGHGSDRWQFVRSTRGECKAARDFVIKHKMLMISPDYRASTSWMGPAAEADVVQILAQLRKRYRVKRILICGGSMGGTGALTFAALHPRLVDGVVAFNGTANLEEYDQFQEAIAQSFGGNKTTVAKEYHKRSAEFSAQKFDMPLAASTGGKDTTVPPESVLRLLKKVSKHNPHVLSLHQPAGGHSTNYQDSVRALEFVRSRWLVPHPAAVANVHPRGAVDRPEMVRWIVRYPQSLPGVVVDETEAKLAGRWQYSTHTPPYVGLGYLHDQKQGKGLSSVTYTPKLPEAGLYEVRLSHCYNIRRSTNTPVTIHHADGESTLRINQQDTPEHKKLFRTLGRYRFAQGTQGWVRISSDGTDGKYVIADAVQFILVNGR